jgi:hypothetical protein
MAMKRLLAALIVTPGLILIAGAAMACEGGDCRLKPEPKAVTAAKPLQGRLQLACFRDGCRHLDRKDMQPACDGSSCNDKPQGDGRSFMKAKP